MQRVKTGIKGLDEMLHGGFLPQTANLVEGAPGTGKTTLGMQFIYNGITLYDEPGIILTFEEFPQQYYRDAAAFGWDFKALEREGRLKVIMTSPEVGRLLSHLEKLTDDPVELRAIQYSFINALKREGLTAVLTKESPALLGAAESEESIAFVVDSYILLRYVEIESAIHKALLVLKLRGSDHAKDIRQFEITSGGIEVQAKFEGREGIMSGSPRLSMADSFVRAFVKKEKP